jgi:hypothetical protein
MSRRDHDPADVWTHHPLDDRCHAGLVIAFVFAAERNHFSQYTSSQAIALLALFPPGQKVKMLCLLPLAKVLPKL